MTPPPRRFVDLHARLRERAAATPSRVALRFLPSWSLPSRVDVTYHELAARSLRVARYLRQRLAPGERVVVALPTTPEFAVAFLACLAARVIAVPVPVPLDTASTARLRGVVGDCAPSLILSTRLIHDHAGAAEAAGPGRDRYEWVFVDDALAGDSGAGQDPGVPEVSGDDIAFLQYTSGSTAAPRGVLVSHRALMANEAAIRDVFGVTERSTVVSWLPLHHDMGLVGGLLQPLYAGARAVILDPLSFVRRPASWLEAISEERADISGGPNFAYDMCARKITAAERARLDLSSWRVAFNGAASVFPQTMRSFRDAFAPAGFRPEAHLPCYGLAEATLLVTASEPDVSWSSRTFSVESLESGVASVAGRADPPTRELVAYPLPTHASVRVIDSSTLEAVKDGVVGEIVVAGDSNGSGYWGDAAATSTTFHLALPDEPARPYVRTGDLGFILDGELFIQGRSKDLIIYRGRNLHPDDLEITVSSCDPAVRAGSAAVFSVPHDGDEAVVVCQEVRGPADRSRDREIAHRIRAALAQTHGVTAHTVALVAPHSLARTTSGKLRRHLVRRQFHAGELKIRHCHTLADQPMSLAERLATAGWPGDSGASLPPDTLTSALCQHIADLLDLPHTPTGTESLSSLGADSLTALRLRHELAEALGIAPPVSTALRAVSIADLAAACVPAGSWPVAAPPRQDTPPAPRDDHPYELNAAQRALWFLQRAYPGSTSYNITRALRVTGSFDPECLARAVGQVVGQHPSLRLTVRTVEGRPVAQIRDPHPTPVDVIDAAGWDEAAFSRWHREFATTPFNLERDLPLRAAVLRRAEDWLLLLSVHHIACDAASLAMIVDGLVDAYREGAPPGPVVSPTPAASPAAHEHAVLAQRRDELLAFWRRELAGELPRLSLPGASGGEPASGASVLFTLPPAPTSALARLAGDAGLTMHNLLLAAWQVLLHRLTGQPEVLVAIPTSGRTNPHLATWVGNLVNVLPVRSRFDPPTRFTEFAAHTQQRVFNALDHRDLPLSELTHALNPDRDRAASSIFQAMFAYYTPAAPGIRSAGAALLCDPDEVVPLGSGSLRAYPLLDYTAQADVCLNVTVRRDTLAFELQGDPERVSDSQLAQIRATWLTLLGAVAEDPRSRLRALPLLPPQEVRDLAAAGHGPRRPRPVHYLASFAQAARRFPDRQAAEDEAAQVTYATLDERSNYVASRLRDLGAGVDTTVVVSAGRSVDYLLALLGIHKADACYAPISPTEAPRRAAAMLAALAPVAVIADRQGRQMLAAALPATGAPAIVELAELTAGRRSHAPSRCSPSQAGSYIMHTSGSTGTPKPAVLTNAGLTNHLWQMIEYFGLTPEDCVGQTGPVSFDVSVWQLLAPLLIGARVRIVPEPVSLSPSGLLAAAVRGGVTLLELVPSAVVGLLDAGLARAGADLRAMVATGEALRADLPQRWARELPSVPLYNAYGPCECTDDVSIGLSACGPAAPTSVSIGRALANTSMYVLDDEMRPAPRGVAGWLWVGGAGVGRGYLGDPRRTAEAFWPDPWSAIPGARMYRTGDLARLTAGGEVEFLGRADSQLKIHGVRIEPGEVEAGLCGCEGVVEAAVRREQGAAGAHLVAYLVLASRRGDPAVESVPGTTVTGSPLAPDEDERLRASLSDRLPRQMLPSVLASVPRLPRSANGKTDYSALRYAPAPVADDSHQPADPLYVSIRSIWASQLGKETIAGQDNFFQLGGQSLLALSIMDQISQVTGHQADVDLIFAHPRLREFVAALRRAQPGAGDHPGAGPAQPPPGHGGPVPASTAQQRFWFLHELAPEQPTLHMPGVVRLRGTLDDRVLEAALREVLERHHVLLARFSDGTGALTWTNAGAAAFTLRRLDLRGVVAELGEEAFDQLAQIEARTPVDLRQELPFRAVLARLATDDWRLLVCVDHIACDAWSLDVFLGELAGCYNRRVLGQPAPATPTRYSFADYCREEARRQVGRESYPHAADWRRVGDGPVRRSPARHRRPHPASRSFAVTGKLAAALRDLTARHDVTPFMVFACALSTLIHSGSPERETILLGTLIAQRERAEWRDLVGPLLNVGVLAVDLAMRDTGLEALDHTREGALRAYRASNLPYQELVDLLRPALATDGSLFDVLLVMQPERRGRAEFAGLTSELIELDTGVSPYPIVVDVAPGDGGYQVTHRYAPERYEAREIESLAADYAAVFRELVGRPESTLAQLLRERTTGGEGDRQC